MSVWAIFPIISSQMPFFIIDQWCQCLSTSPHILTSKSLITKSHEVSGLDILDTIHAENQLTTRSLLNVDLNNCCIGLVMYESGPFLMNVILRNSCSSHAGGSVKSCKKLLQWHYCSGDSRSTITKTGFASLCKQALYIDRVLPVKILNVRNLTVLFENVRFACINSQ